MKPFHILLVEDNEGDILIATEAIEQMGRVNKISITRDGDEAIKFLAIILDAAIKNLPDIILLDINLPKKNGYEVLEFIKRNEHLKHIPVIVLSTSSNPKDVRRAYNQHANCFITKPDEISDYFKIMHAIENFWLSLVKLTVS
ncbi:MAG: response regulator receiver protein [Ferruginibacter sp.]|uniref:response regulator n=1 Tax=Ferruginibacter sp. TaxID=1940288 RepID=UPI00265A4B8F|nr:response regulator [Ferruginibacter sp.]MDB5279895.1 response regulator receiver protein [Ferruginibacter sp.]